MEMRVARPTDRLDLVVEMYRSGLGFKRLGSFEDHEWFARYEGTTSTTASEEIVNLWCRSGTRLSTFGMSGLAVASATDGYRGATFVAFSSEFPPQPIFLLVSSRLCG